MKPLAVTKKKINIEKAEQDIQNIVEILKKTNPLSIYLFGSATNSHFSNQSDLDFLLIYKDFQDLRLAQKALGPLYPLSKYPIDFVWLTQEEFEQKKHIGGIAMTASQSGRQLYTRANNE